MKLLFEMECHFSWARNWKQNKEFGRKNRCAHSRTDLTEVETLIIEGNENNHVKIEKAFLVSVLSPRPKRPRASREEIKICLENNKKIDFNLTKSLEKGLIELKKKFVRIITKAFYCDQRGGFEGVSVNCVTVLFRLKQSQTVTKELECQVNSRS